MAQLGDELLIAYSDGELSTRQREEISCVLDHDPVTSLRLKKMQNTRNRLTVLFNDILEDHSQVRVEDIISFPAQLVDQALSKVSTSSRKRDKQKSLTVRKERQKEQPSHATFSTMTQPVRSRGHRSEKEEGEGVSDRQIVATEVITQSAPALVKPKSTGLKLALNILSACVILGAGLMAGYFYQDYIGSKKSAEAIPNLYAPVVNGGWTTAVINHHSLLRRDVIETAKVNQKNIALIQNQLNSALGMYVAIPTLTSHGLSFARAQILTHNNAKIAQITYLPVQGLPVSLYVKKGEQAKALNNGTLGAVNMVHWAQDGNGFVLAGEMPHWQLIVMSVDVKRQFTQNLARK